MTYQLTQTQLHIIYNAIRFDSSADVRQRAIAIHLLHLGYEIYQVARVMVVEPKEIQNWVDSWNKYGYDGLKASQKPLRESSINLLKTHRKYALIVVGIIVIFSLLLALYILNQQKDPILLQYDGYTFVLQNQSSDTISIEDMVFTQMLGNGTEIVVEASSDWSTGNPSEVLSKECYAIWESPLAGEPNRVSEDKYGCEEWTSFLETRRVFWINQSEEGTNTFTVTRGADLLATCNTAVKESFEKLSCSFDLKLDSMS